MRALAEEWAEVLLRPYFRALGYDVQVCADNTFTLVELKDGGAKLYGRTHGGRVVLSTYDDFPTQMKAAEKLLNRVYGRPKVQADAAGVSGLNAPCQSEYDLSRLTDDEVDTLEALCARARRRPT